MHVHGIIDAHRLPVTHETRRTGSPQVLVLTKQKALFTREAALRKRMSTLLARLKQHQGAFLVDGGRNP